jgi:hypothetical protein
MVGSPLGPQRRSRHFRKKCRSRGRVWRRRLPPRPRRRQAPTRQAEPSQGLQRDASHIRPSPTGHPQFFDQFPHRQSRRASSRSSSGTGFVQATVLSLQQSGSRVAQICSSTRTTNLFSSFACLLVL